MKALETSRWLLHLARQAAELDVLLTPWQTYSPVLFESPPADFIPTVSDLELGVWLAGLVDFPAVMMDGIALAGASPDQLQHWQIEVRAALSRDPEPPLDWVSRALRHLPYWLEHGLTPFAGYYSLRRLHFLTRGRSSQLQALLSQALKPVASSPCPDSLLGQFSDEVPQILAAVEQKSVTVLPQRLPARLVTEIKQFALTTPCYPSLADVEHRDPITGEYLLPKLLFDASQPLAHRYDFHFAEIWTCPAIQQIAADPLWPWLAEQYLGARTQLAMAYLWWSVAFEGPQSRYTGQVYHVDVDRFQFVNFFFYLTDVGGDNGPQVYVTGSHQDMPLELALDQRWSDQALLAVFAPERFQEIHASAGSVILANTLAYHKGKTLTTGTRLMFQMEFTTSTLGENNPQIPRPAKPDPALLRALKANPERFPRLSGWTK